MVETNIQFSCEMLPVSGSGNIVGRGRFDTMVSALRAEVGTSLA
jgi:hypothetical protein